MHAPRCNATNKTDRSPCCVFFFNDTATTEIYTLSLHDALPISRRTRGGRRVEPDGLAQRDGQPVYFHDHALQEKPAGHHRARRGAGGDRGRDPERCTEARRRMSASTTWQACAACGNEIPETDPHPRCPRCRGLLEVRHQPPAQGGNALGATLDARRGVRRGPLASGVWRYYEAVLPTARTHILSYPEGNTPLLGHPAVARWTGAEDVLLKHEGHNPTGSFKDRGMTVGVTQARRVQARAVACASTGNTAAALAAYAALAGLPAL